MSRILLVSPFPLAAQARHGGERSIRGLARALAERHELILIHLGSGEDLDPSLRRACLEVISIGSPAQGHRAEHIARAAALCRGRTVWSADPAIRAVPHATQRAVARFCPDVVQAEFARLSPAIAAVGARSLRVITIHDPAATGLDELPPLRNRASAAIRLDARAAAREENRVLQTVDAAVVFSEEDRAVLARRLPNAEKLTVIPLATEIPARALSPLGTEPPTIAFAGNFSHPPNVEAAMRLGCRIFPIVRAARPDVTLDIAGLDPPPQVRALAGSGVRVHGGVPDLTDLLDRAAVVAAPVFSGGGSRVKVLDALAAGKAVVTTRRGTAGINAPQGEAILVAKDDRDLAAAITKVVGDPVYRGQLARRARRWAERELLWSTMVQRYENLYLRTARRRPLGDGRDLAANADGSTREQ